MQKTCVICGKQFYTKRHNTKYCSDECRAVGNANTREAWEAKSGYIEVQRERMRRIRTVAKEKRNDPFELMLQAQANGDMKEFLTQYQRHMQKEGRTGYVNMVSVNEPGFVQEVLDSLTIYNLLYFHPTLERS